MMKLIELNIAPSKGASKVGDYNPLIGTVKMKTERSAVVMVLSQSVTRQVFALCREIIEGLDDTPEHPTPSVSN